MKKRILLCAFSSAVILLTLALSACTSCGANRNTTVNETTDIPQTAAVPTTDAAKTDMVTTVSPVTKDTGITTDSSVKTSALVTSVLPVTTAALTTTAAATTAVTTTEKITTAAKTTQVTTTKQAVKIDPKIEKVVTTKPTFTNPLVTPKSNGAWSCGTGDPFVMRWNGTYYLYCSSDDTQNGIKVWTSEDLVSWKYGGFCTTEAITKGAYAPEVTYYNGYFYMVTSPLGNGHYVLKSKSPLGPFEIVTDNWGHSIDGHIFIDNDGKWYFYSADWSGIKVYPMSSPTSVSNSGTKTGAYMNGWTEGPMVIYYDGYYYITYTGNHVWSRGYRIDYASGKNCINFTPGDENPILVSTLKTVYGIGHSSTVLGPNMDCYYIVYHSHYNTTGIRSMRIDKLVLDEGKMEVLGPTETATQAPEMPDVYTRFATESETSEWKLSDASVNDGYLLLSDGGKALTTKTFGKEYTAETNIVSINGGMAGILFSYTDENNYGKALFDPNGQKLRITFVVDGKVYGYENDLVKSFNENVDFSSVQQLMVKRKDNRFTFFVNNRTLCSYNISLGGGGSFGVLSEGGTAQVSFTAITKYVNQSSVKDYFKPIPGNLSAVTCRETDYSAEKIDGVKYLTVGNGSVFNYYVQVQGDGKYDIAIKYKSTQTAKLEVYQNQKLVATLTLDSTNGEVIKKIYRNISLKDGFTSLSFRAVSGQASIAGYTLGKHEDVVSFTKSCDEVRDGNIYSDGGWKFKGGKLFIAGAEKSVGKRLYGSENYGDYTFEADITPTSTNINVGILVRSTNPAVGGNGTTNEENIALGTDFVQGYFVGLSATDVFIGKQNYNWTALKSVPATVKTGSTYHLKVTVKGSSIKVWLDGKFMLEYVDPDPYMQGAAGLRVHYCTAEFDNLKLTAE